MKTALVAGQLVAWVVMFCGWLTHAEIPACRDAPGDNAIYLFGAGLLLALVTGLIATLELTDD
jgi:hypothetical protein